MNSVVVSQSWPTPTADEAPAVGYKRLSPAGGSGPQVFETVDLSEQNAKAEIAEIATEPGNSALKLQLAQEGISLTDHSDVGANKRFESFSEKLSYILQLKMTLLTAIMVSLASSGSWGPSGSDEDIEKARSALRKG